MANIFEDLGMSVPLMPESSADAKRSDQGKIMAKIMEDLGLSVSFMPKFFADADADAIS